MKYAGKLSAVEKANAFGAVHGSVQSCSDDGLYYSKGALIYTRGLEIEFPKANNTTQTQVVCRLSARLVNT